VGLSLAVHVALLAVRFVAPAVPLATPADSRLEVVLLNATNHTAPIKAEVLAQVSNEGGGDREVGRARSPLPAESRAADGDALAEQRARVEDLEAQQRRLLALVPRPEQVLDQPGRADALGAASAEALEDQAAIKRMQAQIDRAVEDYNKRPKRLTYGINAQGVAYARYVDAWAARIERIGTERFPIEARGKQYDSLVVLAEIDKHGNVIDVRIPQKSKYPALNRAAREIVLAGQPYERFSPEMAKSGDILQIVRTWTFTNGALATVAAAEAAPASPR
jgi:protein TonB